jgi:Pectate lyase superfamily protein
MSWIRRAITMDALNRRNVLRTGVVGTALIGGAAAVVAATASASAGVVTPTGDGWISVIDHGAVGDGTTDDRAAIQAAFTAAATTTPCKGVYLPPGQDVPSHRGGGRLGTV